MFTAARLERVVSGLAPVTPGWFIVNTADAARVNNEWSGGVGIFESDDFVLRGRPDLTEYVKTERRVHDPRRTAGTTSRSLPRRVGSRRRPHLDGRVRADHEDQERHLRAWDFVHCPPMTAHTFVATGTGPCVILARATGATISSGCTADPRSRSATRRDLRSIRLILSAEGDGRFNVQATGTNSRGLNGRSSRACAAAFPTERRSATNRDKPKTVLGSSSLSLRSSPHQTPTVDWAETNSASPQPPVFSTIAT